TFAAITRYIAGFVLATSITTVPLASQQPTKPDSVQFAQMQGMMGPMMEQMMTAGMTATLRVLAKPESAQQLATFVKNFYDALAGVGVPLRAQSADALYAGRSCNQDFAKLRAVSVTDVVDSGALVTALREAADSASPITKVVLIYDAYGQLSKIKTAGTRSPA